MGKEAIWVSYPSSSLHLWCVAYECGMCVRRVPHNDNNIRTICVLTNLFRAYESLIWQPFKQHLTRCCMSDKSCIQIRPVYFYLHKSFEPNIKKKEVSCDMSVNYVFVKLRVMWNLEQWERYILTKDLYWVFSKLSHNNYCHFEKIPKKTSDICPFELGYCDIYTP